MAEQKSDPRDVSWRRLVPWTEIFNGFKLTLDPNKLFLAALGILVMALTWWVLAVVFGAFYEKKLEKWQGGPEADAAWNQFVNRRDSWNLMHRVAGIGGQDAVFLPEDLAESPAEYAKLTNITVPSKGSEVHPAGILQQLTDVKVDPDRAVLLSEKLFQPKPGGSMTTWPWFEDRGPNPYLMVTGQTGKPWETGHFWEWFAFEQAPVLVEPLVKLLRPVVYLLHPRADLLMRIYCFLVLLATLTIWSVFGGAIARITVMYQTRKEQIDAFEALRFSRRRWLSYIGALLFPLGITLVCLLFGMFLGLFFLIPYVGDILVAGLGWFLFVALGAAMAVLLIGLVSWPMMPATISTEGRDAWEAFSRSYAYLFSKPWQYIWYGLVAIAYGAVLIFFVNFLGSFSLYLSKWTLMHTPGITYAGREPHFLFIYAPTTFGYRDLLLDGAVVKMEDPVTKKVESRLVVRNGRIDPAAYKQFVGESGPLTFNNRAGAALVACWLAVILLVIVGFGYAYFWTASTLIYLLLRRQIDTAEVDEVYLDDDDSYKPPATPVTPPRTPTPVTPTTPVTPATPATQMVDPPTLKSPPPAVVPPAVVPTPTPAPTPTPPPRSEPPASGPIVSNSTEADKKEPGDEKKPDSETTL